MSQHSDLELESRTPQDIQSSKATLDEWRNDPARIGALQTLTVRSLDCEPDDSAYQDFIKSLTQLFESGKSHLQSFQTLKWEADNEFPPSLLPIFEANHPAWSIHLHSPPKSTLVLPSPVLTSLAMGFGQHHLTDGKTALADLQSVVQNSKNLKRLHLYVDVQGCVRRHYNTDFSENGKTFPPLEELTFEWFEVTRSCGEYWLKAMDWSHLRALDFREGSFSTSLFSLLLPVADNLPALESIGLNLPSWAEDIVREQKGDPNSPFSLTRQMFSTARPQSLTDIRVQGYYRSLLPDILNYHTTSLKRLSLHETETSSEDNQRVPLSLEELEEIGTKSTSLEALALDVNISKDHKWPNDVLDALASPRFSSLKKLTVFSLIGIAGEMIQQPNGERGYAPATTEDDIGNLSSSLSTTSLEEIEVRMGEKRTIRGRPVYWVIWENSNRKVLKTNRKDGEAFSLIIASRVV